MIRLVDINGFHNDFFREERWENGGGGGVEERYLSTDGPESHPIVFHDEGRFR
jgi:hypothetical protein